MESSFGRSRLLIYALPLILITTMSTAVGAQQGLFGVGLPGASYLNGFWRGAVGCGAPDWLPGGGPTVYVGGSADYAGGTAFDFSTLGLGLVGIRGFQHSYPNRGVWVGLTLPFDPGPRLGLYLSAWSFLHTGNVHSREIFATGGAASREWETKPYWTIIEGLAILRCGYGFNLLAGLRYDHYDISFKNPVAVGIVSTPASEADLNVRNFIPLVGTQYEHNSYLGSLLFRAVGFPALGGDVNYLESFGAIQAFQGTGHYRRGYFMELFMEYAKKFGPGQLGLFARWNELHAQSTSAIDYHLGGVVAATDNFDFSFNRSSWTLGGSVSLAFNLPY